MKRREEASLFDDAPEARASRDPHNQLRRFALWIAPILTEIYAKSGTDGGESRCNARNATRRRRLWGPEAPKRLESIPTKAAKQGNSPLHARLAPAHPGPCSREIQEL